MGQQKKDVLLTIDGDPVYASEFTRVYQKNLDLVQDESQKSVEGYLDLFIDYKLKVKEAYEQDLDEKKEYQKEFKKYQEQLSRYYIYEDNVTKDLAKEAYERGLEEIEASHILVTSSYADVPEDTLKAYTKIKNIRDRALAGEDFEKLAKETSEEPNADKTGGNLGYFSVFSLVYPFETEAYNTKVGEVSNIVRTRFGYHIIKVHDRRERSTQRTVSHIMISDREDDTRTFDPEERINDIYKLLQQGQTFEDLAKQYSEDKGSAGNGGRLRPFRKGEIKAKVFEDKVFAIKTPGTYTEPFKSVVGWHIARLDSIHGKSSFEDEKAEYERRVKDGSRSKIVVAAVANTIKDKYGFEEGAPYLDYFEDFIGEDLVKKRWEYTPVPEEDDKVIFTIGDRKHYFSDYAEYIREFQRVMRNFGSVRDALLYFYDMFEAESAKQYYKDKLEEEDPEYAGVITEYRDGLLIFDLMQTNIWNKAKKDTVAAKAYYEANKEQYQWKKRVGAVVVNSTNAVSAQKAKQMLENGETVEAIKKQLNTPETVNVIISEGKFEEGAKELPAGFRMEQGIFETKDQDGRYTIVKVNQVLPPTTKEYEDVRGRVMTALQQQLEEDFMDNLRNKYNVEVRKKTLKKLKRKLDK
ncbi:peptidylprolyl isomerase [Marinirhabdus gelatinilytica]|uniref:peptidylprolyl isomerase n=1 Tax=Marinirhabdus gelatinilytica TaxID=1703343 RepID=UPI001474C12D|nr:peptidylprolyl isomerase [Marinirhabdus gelatinilytica]